MSRIIAGSAGGTRLATPAGERTRPTTDRVREALFSALATWNDSADAGPDAQLAGLAVLDLFAGSGGVGLEAASRGASPVVLVEHDQPTARLVRANADKARLRVQVETSSVDSFLSRGQGSFDVIWLDPPYPMPNQQVEHTLELAMPLLVHNGLVVVERSVRGDAPRFPEGTENWSRAYGETVLHYCQRLPQDDAEPTEAAQSQSKSQEES